MAAMNNYTESKANALRRQQDMPTSENLLAYVKTLMRDEILASADAQVERCIKELKKKGLSIKDIALAFDWHDAPYYGKQVAWVVGTQPKNGTCYAFSFLTASILTPKRKLTLCPSNQGSAFKNSLLS
jgi:hypothetical protein